MNEGMGIEARALRAGAFWKPHLELCKKAERLSLSLLGPSANSSQISLAILGAGRLLDVEQEMISSRFRNIFLFDADPGVKGAWRRFSKLAGRRGATVHYCLHDVTGQILSWTQFLRNQLASNNKHTQQSVLTLVKNLPASHPCTFQLPKVEALWSLNILSQISVCWRERLINLLVGSKLFPGLDPYHLPDELENIIVDLNKHLEGEHLRLVAESGAKNILMIFDVFFHYYQQDKSLWQTEPALAIEHTLEEGGRPAWLSESSIFDSWLWHIAPQGIEETDYGVIHEVRAFCTSNPKEVLRIAANV